MYFIVLSEHLFNIYLLMLKETVTKKYYYLILYTESEDISPFDYIPHLRHSLTFANMRDDILLFSMLFNRYGFISTKYINKFLSQAEITTYVCKNMT